MNAENENLSWIKPLLAQLNLLRQSEVSVDLNTIRDQLERSGLVERVRQVVVEINGAAGHDILEFLGFQPRQRSVVRITYRSAKVYFAMHIAVRMGGPVVMFYSKSRFFKGFKRYFRGHMWTSDQAMEFEQEFRPHEITEDDIRAWFSFLLSGFRKRFRPRIRQLIPLE